MEATRTPLPVMRSPLPSKTSCACGIEVSQNAVCVSCRAWGSRVLQRSVAADDGEADAHCSTIEELLRGAAAFVVRECRGTGIMRSGTTACTSG